MKTSELIDEMRGCLQEIPSLKQIKDGFHNPHVKAWKTRLEDLLEEGGSTCAKCLENIKKMRTKISGTDFVRRETYLNQLDALERNLKQTIQTIQVFGLPNKKQNIPSWGKPKSQKLAIGHLMVGEEEVSTDSITLHEVLECLVSLSEDSNHLTSEMRASLIGHLNAIIKNELMQPFLTQKLDVLLGHWPEFQST